MSFWRRLKDRLFGSDRAGEDDPAGDRGSAPPGDLDLVAAGGDQRAHCPEPDMDTEASPRSGAGASRPPRIAGPSGEADDIVRLRRLGAPDGPSIEEAMGILRRVRGTLRETEAIAQVLAAMGERAVPDPVRVACADILAARGDERGALRLLEGPAKAGSRPTSTEGPAKAGSRPTSTEGPAKAGSRPTLTEAITSTAGLLLVADLHASLGQHARALLAIERVLARDIDAPGALERHARWRAALGVPRRPAVPARLDEATIVAPAARGGPFRLLREVARGGAGTVYEAEDEVLGRRVGFKVYHARGEGRLYLEREARLAAALAGPGVVRVFDADPNDGWIALEWIARGSVRDVLSTGDAASLVPIARWAWPLARALARIHDQGFVHADVKPGNVLLRKPDEPVLSDFGIARPRGAASEGGSPGYVSPERLADRPSDPRDDIYGYGRVLEDVLARLDAFPAADLDPFRALARRCLGPDADRPSDGAELLRAMP